MKKTKLYFLLTALLFAGSAMAQSFYFSPYVTPKNEDLTKLVTADGSANIAVAGSKGTSEKSLNPTATSIVDGKTAITKATLYYKMAANSTITFTTTAVAEIKVLFAVSSNDECSLALTNGNKEEIEKITCKSQKLVPFVLSATNCPADTYTITANNKEMYVFEILVTYASAKDIATLNSITVNGKEVEGFAPETTTYNVELPFGTTKVPVVAATATSSNAKVSVTQAESVDGTATITVTAEDETTTQTYTINFTVATCASAELVLSVDSIGAIIETEDLVAPTLTNPHNLSVVYASSNKEVVTVDQTGALTKVGVGEAVITITAAKQTVEGIEYCEDEVSYKVTLTAHIIEGSTTIFEWVVASSNLTAPTADSTSLDAANYGTLTTGKSVVNRYFGNNKFGTTSGMYKLGNNDVAVEFATEGGFLAEDEITIVGQNGGDGDRSFEIGNASAKGAGTEGNIASSTQPAQTANSTYTAVVDKTNEGGVLRLFRLAGQSMYLKSIKVVRPCTVESRLVLDKTAIDVLDSEKTITAPNLDNPNELVVRYESSNTEVVAVDANTGALTKGTKTGMATITISWERQTINFVRYCAGELVYTVTVKSGATAVENTAVAAPATKVIRDGQLLIIREGKTYTAQGVQVQ